MATRPVDEKIVRMKMENQDFKAKAEETLGIFGKIKQGFTKIADTNLSRPVKEMSTLKVGAEGATIPMGNLTIAIDRVASRLSLMGIMGTAALQQITRRATDAGMKIARALTIEGAQSGFREYELKMGSIQTILSNTQGKNSLAEVKDTLGELNDYADKTIYSFGEMTSNIGRFTAAGVSLKDSTTAIKGISNLAAVSGSNSQQASSAMYQLSQALASGKMNLMDWNSVVNAGMGGKVFQDALQKTAKEMGKNIDKTKTFRDSISDGWLTSEVLLSTLGKFAKDESMLEAATKVRTFTQLVETTKEAIGSGWSETWELIVGDFEEASKLWSGVSDVISKSVSDSSKARNNLLRGWAEAGGKTKIIDGLKNVMQSFANVYKAVRLGFESIFPPVTVTTLTKLSDKFLEFTKGLEVGTGLFVKIRTISRGVFSVFSILWEITKDLAGGLAQMVPPGVGDGLLDIAVKFAEMMIKLNDSVKAGNGITEFMTSVNTKFSEFRTKLAEFGILGFVAAGFNKLKDAIKTVLAPLKDFFKSLGLKDVLGAGAVGGMIGGGFLITKKLSGLIESLTGTIKAPGDLIGSIKSLFSGLGDSLGAFVEKSKYDNLIKVAVALGILAVSLKILEGISFQDIGKGLIVLGLTMAGMTAAMSSLSKIKIKGLTGFNLSAMMVSLAMSTAIMAGAVRKLSQIDEKELAKGTKYLVATIAILVGAFAVIGKIKTPSVAKMLSFFMFTGSLIQASVAMVIFSAGLHILIGAIEKIGKIDKDVLVQGLLGMAGALLGIGVAMRIAKGSLSGAAGIFIVTGALMLLVPLIESIGSMKVETLGQGLGGMAAGLVLLVGALKLAKGSLLGAVALGVAAGALTLLMVPIVVLGNMPIKNLAIGIGALAGALLLVGGVAALLTPVIPAIFALGVGMAIIGGSVILASIGLAALGASMAIFTGSIATSIASIMLSFGLFLDGIISLIPKLGTLLGELVTVFVLTIADVIVRNAPAVVTAAGVLILSILNGIKSYLPAIIEAGVGILMGLVDGLIKNMPVLIAAAVILITSFIIGITNAIKENGPYLVQQILVMVGEVVTLITQAIIAVLDAFIGWVPGVSKALTEASEKAGEIIRDRFDGETLGEDLGKDYVNGVASIHNDAEKAASKVGDSTKKGLSIDGFDLGKMEGLDFADGLDSTKIQAMLAGTDISKLTDDGLKSKDTKKTGKEKVEQFANGLHGSRETARLRGAEVAERAVNGLKSVSAYESGTLFTTGYIGGILSLKRSVETAASSVGTTAVTSLRRSQQERSPSKLTLKSGIHFVQGFINGVREQMGGVGVVASEMAQNAINTMNSFISEFAGTFQEDNEYGVTLKPVLDLSGMGTLPNQTYGVSPDTSRTGSLFNQVASAYGQNGSKNLQTTDTQKVQYDVNVNVKVDGPAGFSNDQKLTEKIKTVIVNEISVGNRTVPNKTSLFPF